MFNWKIETQNSTFEFWIIFQIHYAQVSAIVLATDYYAAPNLHLSKKKDQTSHILTIKLVY